MNPTGITAPRTRCYGDGRTTHHHVEPMTPPTHNIQVRPEGDGPEPDVRVRRLLKTALRGHGLRCTGVSALPDPTTAWMPVTNRPGKFRPKPRRTKETP